MTNPDNIVRVRARNGGRASVYEANGWAQGYSSGLLEGNGVLQNTSADMNVLVGGSTTKPDVVLAENPAGYKIALDLVGQQAVAITAPASNSRISAIVAYTDDLSLSSSETTVTGSPASCGLIVVNGIAAATPAVPSDSQIRSAITADGATGSQASYAIVATVEVASETTIITNSNITMNVAQIGSKNIDFATFNFIATNTSKTKVTLAYNSMKELVRLDVTGFKNGTKMIVNFQGVISGGDSTTRTYQWLFYDQNNKLIANTPNGYINMTWGFPAAGFAVIEKTASLTEIVVKMQKQDNSGSAFVNLAQISAIGI